MQRLVGGNNQETLRIDINDDGTDDVEFGSIVWGSLATGNNIKIWLNCLHAGVGLAGTYEDDSVFLLTEIEWDTTSGEFLKYINYSYSCLPLNSSFELYEVVENDFKILTFNNKSLLKQDDEFETKEFMLKQSKFYDPLSNFYQSGDTLVEEWSTYYHDCNPFPTEQATHLGLKVFDNSKLGWIKLKLSNSNILEVLEIGIQK